MAGGNGSLKASSLSLLLLWTSAAGSTTPCPGEHLLLRASVVSKEEELQDGPEHKLSLGGTEAWQGRGSLSYEKHNHPYWTSLLLQWLLG